jgi:hypothetical protein
MLARSVVIDVEADCDEVVARIKRRLQGDLGVMSALMVPVQKVGAGPPNFVGQVTGRSFRMRTSWRLPFRWATTPNSRLEVIGLVEQTGTGSRVRAVIRPRREMYWWGLGLLAFPLIVAAWRREWPLEFLVLVVVVGLWGGSVSRDIHRTAQGLSDLVAP